MRRSYNQIVIEVFKHMQINSLKLYSILEISKATKCTWRTTLKALSLLKELGLTRRVIIKKQERWRLSLSSEQS